MLPPSVRVVTAPTASRGAIARGPVTRVPGRGEKSALVAAPGMGSAVFAGENMAFCHRVNAMELAPEADVPKVIGPAGTAGKLRAVRSGSRRQSPLAARI